MNSGYQPQGSAQAVGEQSPPRADLIPLVCFICPKNSRFSDLSHLLTHISSKGHLHNMFQLNLSREVDEAAELALAEFDSWYKQNGISALLRARKSAREQRDNHQRRNPTPSHFGEDNTMAPRQHTRGGHSNRRGRGNKKVDSRRRDGTVGIPNEDIIKLESDDDDVQNGRGRHEYHPTAHTSYGWHADSSYQHNLNQYSNNSVTQFQDYYEDEDDSSKYDASELYSDFPIDDISDTAKDDTGALILKGVVYPGMAGFDSATEKDRRMRNQKKDPAVLLKLEANSRLVTRTEEVLDTNLDYQRTRDVYDDPSVNGSGDEHDAAFNEPRTKRRAKAKSSYASVQSGTNIKPRPQAQPQARAHPVRSSSRRPRGSLSAIEPALSDRRITRSSTTNRQPSRDTIPLYNHGVHPNVGSIRDRESELGDEDLRAAHIHTPLARQFRRQPHERLPSLALRPGNPNAAFASPTSAFKQSPSHYTGKENNHLLIKSPSSFNPYLHPSGDTIETNNFNPLCPQPRDGFAYRLYSSYDEEPKSSTPSSFNPINTSSTYDSAQISGMTGNPYHRSQPGGDDYPL
ncbi:putative geranylgerany transferase type ii beta subunit [Rosellinia necatrix]|uniref:Putative geranylgerany transferase type ii beta subunit n=1 Tax=Rosellinia necatrix TaxID=77044 RepID=A0A1W2TGT2_ROSNE|nr:putative geranylgerany transferase type ii beta subunit [Rosellinia necatrix]